MKTWKHLTIEQRKVISNGISHNYKLREIAETLGFDPTSISKEVKKNRESTTIGTNITTCKRINR
jgi:IS30 family transposase